MGVIVGAAIGGVGELLLQQEMSVHVSKAGCLAARLPAAWLLTHT